MVARIRMALVEEIRTVGKEDAHYAGGQNLLLNRL